MDRDAVTSAIEPLRTLLRPDGGDVEILEIDPATGAVRLRLVLDDISCADCVMPRPFLEEVAGNVMRRSLPDLGTVTVVDPRDDEPGDTGTATGARESPWQ
jgi:Fe-S cluster biogenesis protein NfuA